MKIYYDGICVMCSGFARWIHRRSNPGSITFIPLQEAKIPIPAELKNTVLVETSDGDLKSRWEAIREILKTLPPPYRWMHRIAGWVPNKLQNWIYDTIASNRYRIFGKHETCQVIK